MVIIFLITAILAWILGLQILVKPSSYILSLADTITITVIVSAAVNFFMVTILSLVRKVFHLSR